MKKKLAFLWVRIRRRRPSTGTMVGVIEQSPANGGVYTGDGLPANHWRWPEGTFLKRRMAEIHGNRTVH